MGCLWPVGTGLRREPSPLHNMAQFAHREGIRYSMSGRSPDSRTPMAGECLPTPFWRSDFSIRLDSLTVAGAAPGLSTNVCSHRLPVSPANPCLDEHLTTAPG